MKLSAKDTLKKQCPTSRTSRSLPSRSQPPSGLSPTTNRHPRIPSDTSHIQFSKNPPFSAGFGFFRRPRRRFVSTSSAAVEGLLRLPRRGVKPFFDSSKTKARRARLTRNRPSGMLFPGKQRVFGGAGLAERPSHLHGRMLFFENACAPCRNCMAFLPVPASGAFRAQVSVSYMQD